MPVIELEVRPEQLVKAAAQLPQAEFDDLVARLAVVRAQRRVPHLSARETELLLKINEGIPENLWRRYEALLEKRDDFALSEAEYAELLALTSQVERAGVDRLRCLIDLADLRGISLDELMDQLGIPDDQTLHQG